MVAINNGNVYITTGTISGNTITGGITVEIQTTKIDYNMDNQVISIPIPISRGGRTALQDGSLNPYARTIDLKRINEAISIQGFLVEETPSRAIDKRNNLFVLANRYGSLKVVWGQGNYQTLFQAEDSSGNPINPQVNTGMFIKKMMFTETAGILSDSGGYTGDPPPERNIAIQIQLVRGKDM